MRSALVRDTGLRPVIRDDGFSDLVLAGAECIVCIIKRRRGRDG